MRLRLCWRVCPVVLVLASHRTGGAVGAVSPASRPAATVGAVSPAARAGTDSATTAVYDAAGIRVIHRFTPASEIVAVRLFLLGGTRQLTPATEGIEALLLTAAVSETQRTLARTGARSLVEPGPDWTATGFVALRRDFATAWSVFAGWFEPVPRADSAIDRARNLLLSAARRRSSHPDLRIQAIARRVAFRDHPYALDPEGTEQSLAVLTAFDLERYAAEHFVRSRLLLVIVGGVRRADVESLVQGTLGRLPVGTYSWTPPPPVPDGQTAWLVEHRPLATNYILGYFVGPEPTHADYYAFQVATQLLSSRLHHVVRNERSLSYAAYAPFLDRAIPVGGIYASSPAPSEVYRLMFEQIGELRSRALPGYVLRDFLDQFTLDRVAEQMTNEVQAEALGRAALYFGDFRMADDGWQNLRRVRPTAVRRAAEKYMRNLRLAYLGDTTLMSGKW